MTQQNRETLLALADELARKIYPHNSDRTQAADVRRLLCQFADEIIRATASSLEVGK